MKVLIVRTRGYSGGGVVLEKMCSLLREKGIDAKLFNIDVELQKDTKILHFWFQWAIHSFKWLLFYVLCRLFPESNNWHLKVWRPIVVSSVKGIKYKFLPFFLNKDMIVVYPDKVYGNFLHAKHVVRYLLFHYAYSEDKNAYGEDDLFIAFREIFNDWKLNKEGYVVTINYFDNSMYHQYNYGSRNGKCYIIRKGKDRDDLPTKFDGPIIDNLPEQEKVRVFNECEICYSYDTQTFYTSIAAVCGCLPIVILEPGRRKLDYFKSYEPLLGVAYGDSSAEIEYALSTRTQLLKWLEFRDQNEKNILLFINLLEKKFSS